MISHKPSEVIDIADSITIIRDGTTVESFNVEPGEEVSEDRLIRGMVGRTMESRYPERVSHPGDVLFEVKDWTVEHPENPGRLVADHSSFEIRAGEVVGFAGLMGAGRTELARSLFGRSYGNYLGGHIYLHGKEIAPHSVRHAIDDGLAYCTEDRKMLGLNLLDTIRKTIVSADLPRIAPHHVLDLDKEFQAAEYYRKELSIKTPDVNELVSQLSGGNQQKVVVG